MTPDDLKKHGLLVKAVDYDAADLIADDAALFGEEFLEPIATPDVAQARAGGEGS